MKIFISHISDEQRLAIVMKEWIESSFLCQIDVFVSSDPKDIPAGSKWLEKINNALDESQLIIILYSPISRTRPWINFEAGCGWIKNVPIIPVCHSGLKVTEIGAPISSFQGVEIDDDKFVAKFLDAICRHAGFEKYPRIDENIFLKELREAIEEIPSSDQIEILSKPGSKFSDIQVKILKILAMGKNQEDSLIEEPDLAQRVGLQITALKYHVKLLVDGGFVYAGSYFGAPMTYSIDDKGITYLVENNILP